MATKGAASIAHMRRFSLQFLKIRCCVSAWRKFFTVFVEPMDFACIFLLFGYAARKNVFTFDLRACYINVRYHVRQIVRRVAPDSTVTLYFWGGDSSNVDMSSWLFFSALSYFPEKFLHIL